MLAACLIMYTSLYVGRKTGKVSRTEPSAGCFSFLEFINIKYIPKEKHQIQSWYIMHTFYLQIFWNFPDASLFLQ